MTHQVQESTSEERRSVRGLLATQLCDFRERWEDCAARETMEETGLKLKNIHFKTVVNAVEVDKNYHYVDLFLTGEVDLDYKAEPENLEPHKSEGK